MSTLNTRTVRDVAEVDLRGGRLTRVELLADGACVHVRDLQVRYQGIFGDGEGYALFRHDARLLVFGVAEARVSGALSEDDPVAVATLVDENGSSLPWRQALSGAPAAGLSLELESGVTVSLACSRATLGFEGPGTLLEGWVGNALAVSPNGPPQTDALGHPSPELPLRHSMKIH
jgi:hypothetical protein